MARAARAVTSMSERRNRVWLGIEVPLSVIRNERSVSIIETRRTGNTPPSSITSRFDELPGTVGARVHWGRGDGAMRATDDLAIVERLAHRAVELAEALLREARAQQTADEHAQAKKLARMMADPHGKELTIALADQAFRSHRPERIADQLAYLLERYGVPQHMDWWERGALLPGVGGAGGRPSAHALSRRGTPSLPPSGRTDHAQVHQPRHGGVPRPRPDGDGLPRGPRRAGVPPSERGDRAPGLFTRLAPRSARPHGAGARAARAA